VIERFDWYRIQGMTDQRRTVVNEGVPNWKNIAISDEHASAPCTPYSFSAARHAFINPHSPSQPAS